jgi:hypothetical protein
MPVIGSCYTGETASQIQARELQVTQINNEVQIRNLLISSHANPASKTINALISANVSAAEASGYLIEIAPSLTIDAAGNVSNKHK